MKKIVFAFLYIIVMVHFSRVEAQSNSLKVEEFKLKNGLEIKMIQFGSVPGLTIGCYVNVGKKTEIPGQQFLSTIVSAALMLGNEKYTRIDQDNLLTKLGSNLTPSTNDNFTELTMRFLNKDVETAMDLFSSILLKPSFSANEIKLLVERTLNYNNPYKMDISELASMISDYTVFGTSNPLGRHFYAAQLNKVTTAQIKEFYKFNYTPKNTKIILAGNFDALKMKEILERSFGTWTAAYDENNGSNYEVLEIQKNEYFFVNKNDATQTCLQWNKKSPAGNSKEAILFQLANYSFNVLLFDEIRAKEGKTYGINSIFRETNNNGIYSVVTQVRNEVVYETTISLQRVLKQFYETGITQEQLDKSKATLRNERLAIETPESIISFYNPILYKDLNKRNEYLSIIDAVLLDQVNKTVKKYFNPGTFKLIIAGDEHALDFQLQKISGLVKLPVSCIEKDN